MSVMRARSRSTGGCVPAVLLMLAAVLAATGQFSRQAQGRPAIRLPGQPTGQASAQDATAPPAPVAPKAFDSPAATIRTFITAMSEGDTKRAVECLDLSLVEVDGAADRAQELYRCINRIEVVQFDFLEDIAGSAIIGQAAEWTFFPRDQEGSQRLQRVAPGASIVLAKSADARWKFSAETVKGSRSFWESLRRAGIEAIGGLKQQESLRLWERFESV